MAKKISYVQLQKDYAGKIVALSGKEDKVLGAGKDFDVVFSKLKRMGIKAQDCVFVGPVSKMGTINVYFLSLRGKEN